MPKIRGFPLSLIVALTTVLRTTVLHCDGVYGTHPLRSSVISYFGPYYDPRCYRITFFDVHKSVVDKPQVTAVWFVDDVKRRRRGRGGLVGAWSGDVKLDLVAYSRLR